MLCAGGVGGVTLGDGVWVVCGEISITLGEDVVGWWGGWSGCRSDILSLL